MIDTAIVTSLIVAAFALVGTIVSSKYISNVRVVKLELKMDELEKKVSKHNGLVERMYNVEHRVGLLEHCLEEQEKQILKYEC